MLINLFITKMSTERDQIIESYFYRGFSYKEILCLLESQHGIKLSNRQLHRVLRRLSLYRRREKTSINDVIDGVSKELEGSGSSFGYRLMRQQLQS